DGRPVMSEVSTYLAKGRKLPGAKPRAQVPHAEFTAPQPTALWRLDPIIGQRYARVSGDYNPIHLNGLAAKGFGFPRQIAHGMYGASRALSAMDPRMDSYRWDVSFAKPIVLPATVGYALTDGQRHEAANSAVFDLRTGKPHVLTQVSHLGVCPTEWGASQTPISILRHRISHVELSLLPARVAELVDALA